MQFLPAHQGASCPPSPCCLDLALSTGQPISPSALLSAIMPSKRRASTPSGGNNQLRRLLHISSRPAVHLPFPHLLPSLDSLIQPSHPWQSFDASLGSSCSTFRSDGRFLGLDSSGGQSYRGPRKFQIAHASDQACHSCWLRSLLPNSPLSLLHIVHLQPTRSPFRCASSVTCYTILCCFFAWQASRIYAPFQT